MLPKPKELTGKAIPFMEWCGKKSCFTTYKYPEGEEDYYEIPREIFNFFNQPFTPEMLTEYFDGEWKQEPDDINYDYYINGDIRCSVYLDFYPDYCKYTFGDLGDNMFIFKSLNDLITLCTLAGVELTWKGETE